MIKWRMLRSDTLRRLAAWMACFAILLAALAPSISSALAAGRSHSLALVEICTPGGLARIWLAEQDMRAPEAPSAVHAGQCPFCLPHPGAVAVPVMATLATTVIGVASDFMLPTQRPPASRLSWTRPHSHAPPVFC